MRGMMFSNPSHPHPRSAVSSLPTPAARRLTKPSWKDARLIIGILLVLLSIVIGALAFRAADDRVGVWTASRNLTPGESIGEGDLKRVDVQLGDGAAEYVRSDQRLPHGAVINRDLRSGELLPRSAVVSPLQLDVQRVPVRVDPISLSNLTKGSRVTVLAAAPPEPSPAGARRDVPPKYEVIARRVTVHSLPKSSGGVISTRTGSAVILVVPEDQVTELLSLDDKDHPIKLVLEAGSPEKKD